MRKKIKILKYVFASVVLFVVSLVTSHEKSSKDYIISIPTASADVPWYGDGDGDGNGDSSSDSCGSNDGTTDGASGSSDGSACGTSSAFLIENYISPKKS